MSISRLPLLLLFTLCAALSAIAQSPQRITLEQAIDIALQNNITLRQAENSLVLQRANVTSAQMDFLPNLNFGINGNRNTGRQFVQETLSYDDLTTLSSGASFNSGVTLFDGLRNINNLRAAQTSKLSAEENLQRAKENVIFNTASSYLSVLLNQELLKISQQNLDASRKQLEQVKAQVEVGMRPMVDLYNQEAVVANNEFQIVERENALNMSMVQVLRILALDTIQDYEFVTPGIDEDNLKVNTYSLPQLIERAMMNRSDLRGTEAQIKLSEYNLRIARGAFLPTVSLSGSLSGGYSDQFRERTAAGQFVDVGYWEQITDRNRRYSFGFNVQVPIFNRYNTRLNVQRSQVDYKNAMLELESKKLEINQEVRQAYNDYLSATKQLDTTERALLAASKAYETEQERYRVGASTLIELTRSNAEFVSASSNRVQAIYRFVFQEQLLNYYLGQVQL
jgi:outer membrane protein